jgi:hypothetical protein
MQVQPMQERPQGLARQSSHRYILLTLFGPEGAASDEAKGQSDCRLHV